MLSGSRCDLHHVAQYFFELGKNLRDLRIEQACARSTRLANVASYTSTAKAQAPGSDYSNFAIKKYWVRSADRLARLGT
jgi:hypothetical protein